MAIQPPANMPGMTGVSRVFRNGQWYYQNAKGTNYTIGSYLAAHPAPVAGGKSSPAPTTPEVPTGPEKIDPNQFNQFLTSLPYDSSLDQYDFSLEQDRMKFLQDIADNQNSTNRAVATKSRDIQQQMPDAFRGVLNNFAARGMARSSGYAQKYADTQRDFTNQMTDLQAQSTNVMSDAERAKAAYDALYNQRKTQIQQSKARLVGGL